MYNERHVVVHWAIGLCTLAYTIAYWPCAPRLLRGWQRLAQHHTCRDRDRQAPELQLGVGGKVRVLTELLVLLCLLALVLEVKQGNVIVTALRAHGSHRPGQERCATQGCARVRVNNAHNMHAADACPRLHYRLLTLCPAAY